MTTISPEHQQALGAIEDRLRKAKDLLSAAYSTFSAEQTASWQKVVTAAEAYDQVLSDLNRLREEIVSDFEGAETPEDAPDAEPIDAWNEADFDPLELYPPEDPEEPCLHHLDTLSALKSLKGHE